MFENLFIELWSIKHTVFWSVVGMSATAAFLIRELNGGFLLALVLLPVLIIGGLLGHVVLDSSGYHLGTDPLTDGIMGATFGMIVSFITAIIFRHLVTKYM